MTDIEQKALALVNEIERERAADTYDKIDRIMRDLIIDEALCRAIEQHEAFRQEVSDVMTYIKALYPTLPRNFNRFINADVPDALVDVWGDLFTKGYNLEQFRAALDARGLEIREKGDD
jgi:hypothetical protein